MSAARESPAGAEFTIRPAVAADAAAILACVRGIAEYEKLSHHVAATEESIRESLFGTQPAAESLIAHAGDEVAGFAVFFPTYSTFLARRGLWLEDIFVFPRWRGHGLGRRLFEAVARIAAERGCGRFEWAVLDWNEPAIGFYKSLGAKPMHDWTVFRLSGESLQALAALPDTVSR